eukprot:6416696-Prymnesium_polylepis.1
MNWTSYQVGSMCLTHETEKAKTYSARLRLRRLSLWTNKLSFSHGSSRARLRHDFHGPFLVGDGRPRAKEGQGTSRVSLLGRTRGAATLRWSACVARREVGTV